jgi:hypothetical protein
MSANRTGAAKSASGARKKNGQLVVEAFSVRTQMYGRLQPCKVDTAGRKLAAPSPAAPQSSAPQAKASHVLNPPYLNEFPSVDRVIKEVQGKDANDAALRQEAAFRVLKQMLEDAAGPRWFRNQLTSDERKLDGEYYLAQQKLAQQLHFPMGGYVADPHFRQELFTHFGLTQSRVQAANANAEYQAKHDARIAEQQPQAAAASAAGQPAWVNDPTSVATRRCLELGGSPAECLGKGLKAGFFGLLGVNPDELAQNLGAPPINGLGLTGAYKSPSGVLLRFSEDTVSILGCGKLVGVNDGYSAQRLGNQFAVRIANQPQPLPAALGPDGKLSAPPAADITGKVIIGYENQLVQKRYTADNTIVPGSAHVEQVPVYALKTLRCGFGTLLPGPPEPPQKDAIASLVDVASMIFSGPATHPSAGATPQNLIAPGLRMAGVYTGQDAFKIEFHSGGAMVDCKEAHVAEAYSVSNTRGEVLVTLRNAASPLTFALQPNGTLLGSGTIQVAGRLVTGMNGDTIVFRPVTASCTLGALVAK